MRNPFRPHIVRLGNSRVFAIRKLTILGWRYQSRQSRHRWWAKSSEFFSACCTPVLIELRHELEISFSRDHPFSDDDYARCLLRDPDFGKCDYGARIPMYGFPEPPMPGD